LIVLFWVLVFGLFKIVFVFWRVPKVLCVPYVPLKKSGILIDIWCCVILVFVVIIIFVFL
jgi:hypothetical protein